MPKILSLVSLVMFSLNSYGIEPVFERKMILECNAYADEVKTWWINDKDDVDHEVAEDKIDRAIQILQEIRQFSEQVLKSATQNGKCIDDFVKWIEGTGYDCPAGRYSITKALINSSSKNPDIKSKVEKEIRLSLTAEKYLTFVNASVDSVLVEYGIKHEFWNSSAALTTDVAQLRLDIKHEIQNWGVEYTKLFDQFVDLNQAGSEQALEQFKLSPGMEKLEKAFCEEHHLSGLFITRLRDFISKLN